VTTSDLGLILLVGAGVVLAAIVAARWRTESACRAC
jgi:hypothetical protein